MHRIGVGRRCKRDDAAFIGQQHSDIELDILEVQRRQLSHTTYAVFLSVLSFIEVIAYCVIVVFVLLCLLLLSRLVQSLAIACFH